jgi:hypothetical protein
MCPRCNGSWWQSCVPIICCILDWCDEWFGEGCFVPTEQSYCCLIRYEKTFLGRSPHSTLAEVLLYIMVSTKLAIGCQLEDTYCWCYFALIGWMCFTEGSAVADAGVAGVLALWAHVLVIKGVLLPAAVLPDLLFLAQFVDVWLVLFSPLPFFWLTVLAWVANVYSPGGGVPVHLWWLLRSLLLSLAADSLELQSLDAVVARCFVRTCLWREPPPGLLVTHVALWVFWFLPLLDEALWFLVVRWLFGLV